MTKRAGAENSFRPALSSSSVKVMAVTSPASS
jgi:hypothetical protein